MNNITLTGNITKDIELKNYNGTTKQGVYIVNTIAVREDKETTYFFDFKAFDNTAKLISGYCKKGTKILINGKLVQNKWQDQQGNNHTNTSILINTIEILTPKEKTQENSANTVQNTNYNNSNQNNNPPSNNGDTPDFPF